MISFLKKYKGFLYGLLIHRLILEVLLHFGLIQIDHSAVLSNILSFIFSWVLISLPIQYFQFLKQHATISLKLLLLIFVLLTVIVNDMNSKIPDNPITFVGLVGIGLYFFSIIMPSYFKKYALSIIGFYILSLSYFYYLRVYINDEKVYFEQEKEIKIILTIPFIAFILGWFYQQWKEMKTLELKKSQAELSLLKSQINPHFFFNTLNNLYGLIIEKSAEAPNVVLKLSDLMRYTIYMGKEDLVPLREEVEYLKNYIDLHRIRYQKNVDIIFNDSQCEDCQIAPLIFIIPLENAFKHGVESLMKDAYIRMDIEVAYKVVHFRIENNFELKAESQTVGIGIENLKQRLQLLYPNQHQLQIEVKNSVYQLDLTIETR